MNHCAHVSFYQRYIRLIEEEVRKEKPNLINVIEIEPSSIVKICCQLPIWAMMCHHTKNAIYIVLPKVLRYHYSVLDQLESICHNDEKISIHIITDPDTDVKCFLYI